MKVFKVKALKNIDLTRYSEGNLFIAGDKVSMLVNGKLKDLFYRPSLKDYVKKSEVKQMIDDAIKELK